jgi:dTDP-4-amino-4,6-dideoxygalactose transaminase
MAIGKRLVGRAVLPGLLLTLGVADSRAAADATIQAMYYEQVALGFNYRLTDLQAALGLSQLKRLESMHASRVALANRYDSLMSDLPLERIWRDARVERIWEGTSEIQRHIISRALLRPLGA